jgi:hypothetical protein
LDWFERLTGFRETDYHGTRSQLSLEGGRLRSLVNNRSWNVGTLELVSLETLRRVLANARAPRGKLTVRSIVGDVRRLHQDRECARALFQVASQFNLLEMTAPGVTPEDGVTRYETDPTQGPACAIAAGAATIYRNYFVPVAGEPGQTREGQIDCLSGVGDVLMRALKRPIDALWDMRNGYALCHRGGLAAIADYLRATDAASIDAIRAALMIGLHRDVEVTEGTLQPPQLVSQAFCSALPVAYSFIPEPIWAPFATLVLEAAYEATLWAALANASGGASNIVLLTRVRRQAKWN